MRSGACLATEPGSRQQRPEKRGRHDSGAQGIAESDEQAVLCPSRICLFLPPPHHPKHKSSRQQHFGIGCIKVTIVVQPNCVRQRQRENRRSDPSNERGFALPHRRKNEHTCVRIVAFGSATPTPTPTLVGLIETCSAELNRTYIPYTASSFLAPTHVFCRLQITSLP